MSLPKFSGHAPEDDSFTLSFCNIENVKKSMNRKKKTLNLIQILLGGKNLLTDLTKNMIVVNPEKEGKILMSHRQSCKRAESSQTRGYHQTILNI